MPRTATVRANVSPDLKHAAEAIFTALGVSPAEAIRSFCRQVTLHRALPFEVKPPNTETREAMQQARLGENLVEYASLDDLKSANDSSHSPDCDETV